MEADSRPTILIIDDEELVRTNLAIYLGASGFETIEAENGRIGLERFHEITPDIILVDLNMPEVDGFQVLSEVRDQSPETPIIVISGAGTIESAIEATRSGAWDFILKPVFDMSVVVHVINKAWEHALLLKENRNYHQYLEDEVQKRTKELKQEILVRKRAEEELHTLNEELENRILKRTQELEESLEQLRKTQKQLVVQEKLASLGSLTAGIAHEIKNPLNFVNNFAEMCQELVQQLQAEMEKEETNQNKKEIHQILEMLHTSTQTIEKHGSRADGIIQAMLLQSRGRQGEWERIRLHPLLQEYMDLAYHSMRAKDQTFPVQIESDFDDAIEQINIIPQDLSRAFLNIINNALWATYEKFKDAHDAYVPLVKISTKELGNQIEIRVWDNGKGIPQENLNKIFEPFYTTKPTGSGTGLGLSLCYEIIVQEHQGSIHAESQEGEFTAFILHLPKEEQAKTSAQ
ncbi:MAG: response regulator [SAR324 cluster bacterium]|nr:response regulator [SAR324 cluster bacterium]